MMKILFLILGFSIFAQVKCDYKSSIDTIKRNSQTVLHQTDTLFVQSIETDTISVDKLCVMNELDTLVIYTLRTIDGSSIDYLTSYKKDGARIYDCFAMFNNGADGNQFLFYNYVNRKNYTTHTCFSGFYPLIESVDLKNKGLLLENNYRLRIESNDTIDIDCISDYVPYQKKPNIMKAKLYQL